MSIRTFVTLSSALLMVWLGMAYVYTPVVRGGVDPMNAQPEQAEAKNDMETVDLTVSVSPSEVSPD
jgi:hypothetical protein